MVKKALGSFTDYETQEEYICRLKKKQVEMRAESEGLDAQASEIDDIVGELESVGF